MPARNSDLLSAALHAGIDAAAQLCHDQLRQTRESYQGLNEEAPLGHVFERARDDFHYMQGRIDSTELREFTLWGPMLH